MKSKALLSSLAFSCFISSLDTPVLHAESGFKCYGISGPGENDCDPTDHDGHTCGGESRRDRHLGDWKVVASESACKQQGGFSEAEAREKLGLPPKE
jgi:uncharacterized membrane protein